MKRIFMLVGGLILASILLVIAAGIFQRNEQPVRAQLISAGPAGELSAQADASYARAVPGGVIRFPKDHGPHPDYQTEWWYYTGNLQTESGRHFGYQLTFFRSAVIPPAQRVERASRWASDQAYMAHFAISDVSGEQHQAFERLERGAAGLAGAQADPFEVWLEDWSVETIRPNVFRLRAGQGSGADRLSLDLELSEAKVPVLQGQAGYSQKGPDPGDSSYYYSLTRLKTQGSVQVSGATYTVSGLSWMDHEYSTSALSPGQVGWDWFSIQMSDGSELMVFQIRRADGSTDPFSSGTWVAADGTTRSLKREDFSITTQATWRSPESGSVYPARWTVRVPSLELELDIEPYLADQELNVSYVYWEGAVSVRGQRAGSALTGAGYVELTGYTASTTTSP